MIGHISTEHEAAGEAGIRPYVYVESVDDALGAVSANGGRVVIQAYAEGDLWVGVFEDPAGNVVGVWQRGPRGGAERSEVGEGSP